MPCVVWHVPSLLVCRISVVGGTSMNSVCDTSSRGCLCVVLRHALASIKERKVSRERTERPFAFGVVCIVSVTLRWWRWSGRLRTADKSGGNLISLVKREAALGHHGVLERCPCWRPKGPKKESIVRHFCIAEISIVTILTWLTQISLYELIYLSLHWSCKIWCTNQSDCHVPINIQTNVVE